jgi:hypothetical protein
MERPVGRHGALDGIEEADGLVTSAALDAADDDAAVAATTKLKKNRQV